MTTQEQKPAGYGAPGARNTFMPDEVPDPVHRQWYRVKFATDNDGEYAIRQVTKGDGMGGYKPWRSKDGFPAFVFDMEITEGESASLMLSGFVQFFDDPRRRGAFPGWAMKKLAGLFKVFEYQKWDDEEGEDGTMRPAFPHEALRQFAEKNPDREWEVQADVSHKYALDENGNRQLDDDGNEIIVQTYYSIASNFSGKWMIRPAPVRTATDGASQGYMPSDPSDDIPF